MSCLRRILAISPVVLALGLIPRSAHADFLSQWNSGWHWHRWRPTPPPDPPPSDPSPATTLDSLAIVAVDGPFPESAVVSGFANGPFSSVTLIDASKSPPTLDMLTPFTDVLVWTAGTPPSSSDLGDVLADYYDEGGKHVTIAAMAFSIDPPVFNQAPLVTGRISTGDYAGFAIPADPSLPNITQPSGVLVATPDGQNDPIFSGIDLSAVRYDATNSLADPVLAPGATLLATDGNGVDMIARSANGVVDVNIYPGSAAFDSPDEINGLFGLLANTFADPASGPVSGVPESSPLLALAGSFCAAVAVARRRGNVRP